MHITQNVDGLAGRAGAKNIIEIHGNLFSTYCSECGLDRPDLSGVVPFPTRCKECGGLVRPGVVWFNEPVDRLGQAIESMEGVEVFLVVGTSAVVQPAASLAMVAKRRGTFVAELNIEQTPLTGQLDLLVQGPAGSTLPAAVKQAFS